MPKRPIATQTAEESLMQDAAAAVGELHDADLFLLREHIYASSQRKLERLVTDNRRRPNLTIIISTYGGSPDAAYRICRLAHRAVGDEGIFRLMIPSHCKSAGTLIAIGADEIVMGDNGELGPLDVQVQSRDEVGEYNSGLTQIQAMSFLEQESLRLFLNHFDVLHDPAVGFSTKLAAEIAAQHTRGLFQVLYRQLDPMRLGENDRAMLIATEYAKRVTRANVTMGGIDKLIAGYPSHSFVIDRDEAATVFQKIDPPNQAEARLFDCLLNCGHIDHDRPYGLVACLYSQAPKPIVSNQPATESHDGQAASESVAQAPAGRGEAVSGTAESDAAIPTPGNIDSPPSGNVKPAAETSKSNGESPKVSGNDTVPALRSNAKRG